MSGRSFGRAMGVARDGSGGLVLAGHNALGRFFNVVPEGRDLDGHDAVYVPRMAWYTGNLHAHDVAVAPSGAPIFVNTAFACR